MEQPYVDLQQNVLHKAKKKIENTKSIFLSTFFGKGILVEGTLYPLQFRETYCWLKNSFVTVKKQVSCLIGFKTERNGHFTP